MVGCGFIRIFAALAAFKQPPSQYWLIHISSVLLSQINAIPYRELQMYSPSQSNMLCLWPTPWCYVVVRWWWPTLSPSSSVPSYAWNDDNAIRMCERTALHHTFIQIEVPVHSHKCSPVEANKPSAAWALPAWRRMSVPHTQRPNCNDRLASLWMYTRGWYQIIWRWRDGCESWCILRLCSKLSDCTETMARARHPVATIWSSRSRAFDGVAGRSVRLVIRRERSFDSGLVGRHDLQRFENLQLQHQSTSTTADLIQLQLHPNPQKWTKQGSHGHQ